MHISNQTCLITANTVRFKTIYYENSTNKTVNYKILVLSLLASVISFPNIANNLSISYSQTKQNIALQQNTIQLSPAGAALYLSIEVTPKWAIDVNYQRGQDQQLSTNSTAIELEQSSWGAGVNYYFGDWFISSNVSVYDDYLLLEGTPRSNFFREEVTKSVSLGTSIGISGVHDHWFTDFSISAQYSDWQADTERHTTTMEQQPIQVFSTTSGNSTTLSTSASVARLWQVSLHTGVLAGANLSWHYMLGQEELNTNQLRATSIRIAHRQRMSRPSSSASATSSDNNYGQASLYLSYDINERFSIDIDTAIDLASGERNQSYTMGIAYSF